MIVVDLFWNIPNLIDLIYYMSPIDSEKIPSYEYFPLINTVANESNWGKVPF